MSVQEIKTFKLMLNQPVVAGGEAIIRRHVVRLSAVLVAGVANGSFAVPMKWTRNWAWGKHVDRMVVCCFGRLPPSYSRRRLFLIPSVYPSSDPSILFWVCAAGAAWGASQVFFGLGIKRAGMALGFAIVLGLATATGSLIPLFQLHSNQSGAFAWHGAVVGIAIILVGISLCSYAGGIKDRATPASGAKSSTGILLCVAAGLGGSMINIGIVLRAPSPLEPQLQVYHRFIRPMRYGCPCCLPVSYRQQYTAHGY